MHLNRPDEGTGSHAVELYTHTASIPEWELGIELKSPARAVCTLATEPCLQPQG